MSYLNSFYKWIILATKSKIQLEIDFFELEFTYYFSKVVFVYQICRNLMKNKSEKEKNNFE